MNYLEKKNEEKLINGYNKKIKRYRTIWNDRLLDLANTYPNIIDYETIDKFCKSLSFEDFRDNFYNTNYETIRKSIDRLQIELFLFSNIEENKLYKQYIRTKKFKKIIG